MRQRTRFWTKGLLWALLGGLIASPAFAESSLRWGTPKIDGVNQSCKNTAQHVLPSHQKEQLFHSPTTSIQRVNQPVSAIQQVRFNRQDLPAYGSEPSQEALIDTQNPESRPQFSTPGQAPTPQRNDPSLFGDDLGNSSDNDRFRSESLYSDDEMSDFEHPTPQKGVVINCPEGNILKPISDINYDIRLQPGDMAPKECGLVGNDLPFPSRDWGRICFMWKASALCHKPLYFEEEALERYGHTLVQEEFQPLVSGAKFFLTIPILPYKMGLNPPCECIYTLGHYRPGSCAPYMMDPFPVSLRAGLIQAGAVVGGVAIIP